MKKALACLLAIAILASLGITAFAAEVPSVEAEDVVPAVAEAVDADGNDVADAIVITDYEEKDTISEDAQKQLDDVHIRIAD